MSAKIRRNRPRHYTYTVNVRVRPETAAALDRLGHLQRGDRSRLIRELVEGYVAQRARELTPDAPR
jgi:hypothetical protein